MVEPTDRAKFLGRFLKSSSRPQKPIDDLDLARILASEEPSFEDIKTLLRGARYTQGYDEKFEYANSLLPEASDYLGPHTLRALVRADITVEQAATYLEQNETFFGRLVNLLPSIIQFLSKEARHRNPRGIISTIDDCHNDFQATGNASRRDRQIREAKEKLVRAGRLARESATALKDAEEHFQYEFDHYREAYYRPVPGPARFLGDLIEELRMCAGVLDIMHEIADIKPKRLFVYGNDQRTNVVEWAYHICTMWDGPKLVTTPGSDFAALCSLLFEAVSGNPEESLAGAINRYARSEDRKQWDRDGEDEVAKEDDNFLTEKNIMRGRADTIELCRTLQKNPGLSDMAKVLLDMRVKHAEREHEEARTKYGPRQVYPSQMNQEQWQGMLLEAINRFKPEQIDDLDDMIMNGKSLAMSDIEYGQRERAIQQLEIDAKARKPDN